MAARYPSVIVVLFAVLLLGAVRTAHKHGQWIHAEIDVSAGYSYL